MNEAAGTPMGPSVVEFACYAPDGVQLVCEVRPVQPAGRGGSAGRGRDAEGQGPSSPEPDNGGSAGASAKGRGKGRGDQDPSRGAYPDKRPSGAPRRDDEAEAALAGRDFRRSAQIRADAMDVLGFPEPPLLGTFAAMDALGFPEPPLLGTFVQGADRPPPNYGRAVGRELSNQLLQAQNLGVRNTIAHDLDSRLGAFAEAKRPLVPAPRTMLPVPTVASLMYSN